MNDDFEDDFGVEHEFIVLQYWFFYAMNNWGEKGGRNDHEGDWESVFIFLDSNSKEPEYVAYSAHKNDGNAEPLNVFQYDSVRREWNSNEVIKDNGQVISLVALGSHANYPNNGDNGLHDVRGVDDKTSDSDTDRHIYTVAKLSEINETNPVWTQYKGLWGTETSAFGGDGPQGPNYIDVTGQVRFH